MIAELEREGLTGLGVRFRAAHLLEQAGYTLELATQDGAALDRLLPPGYVDEVKSVASSVQTGLTDRSMLASEAHEAVEAHHRALRHARAWRRKVARRAGRARRIGRDVPEVLARVPDVDSSASVVAQVRSMLAWVESEPTLLPGDDMSEVIQEGRTVVAKLRAANAGEELARVSIQPEPVQSFFREKGALFVGLRVINDAAHELHAADPAAAGRYNLSILTRRTAAGEP